MKKILLVIVSVLLLVSPVLASEFEKITVSSTPIGFTVVKIGNPAAPAVAAACSLEGADIRWRSDGINPTTTVGHLMSTGEKIMLKGNGDIKNFKAISVTTNGTLSCTYFSEMFE